MYGKFLNSEQINRTKCCNYKSHKILILIFIFDVLMCRSICLCQSFIATDFMWQLFKSNYRSNDINETYR